MPNLLPDLDEIIDGFFYEHVEQILDTIADGTSSPEQAAMVAQQVAQRLQEAIAATDWAARKKSSGRMNDFLRRAMDDDE